MRFSWEVDKVQYFLMSTHFNKTNPSDFGLECIDGKYIRREDGTEWVPRELYDLGWGREVGFYKVPLGSFDELINIVVNTADEEDMYGATAIIDEMYPKELKLYLLNLMSQTVPDSVKKRLNEAFCLHRELNRTASVGMTLTEIKEEYDQWMMIADFYSKYEKKRKFWFFKKK